MHHTGVLLPTQFCSMNAPQCILCPAAPYMDSVGIALAPDLVGATFTAFVIGVYKVLVREAICPFGRGSVRGDVFT